MQHVFEAGDVFTVLDIISPPTCFLALRVILPILILVDVFPRSIAIIPLCICSSMLAISKECCIACLVNIVDLSVKALL
jgi:hypothetical protein